MNQPYVGPLSFFLLKALSLRKVDALVVQRSLHQPKITFILLLIQRPLHQFQIAVHCFAHPLCLPALRPLGILHLLLKIVTDITHLFSLPARKLQVLR